MVRFDYSNDQFCFASDNDASMLGRPKLATNGLQLPEGGDFEAIHFQPSTNFDRSTKLDLTTEPPLLGRCCCAFVLYLTCSINPFILL